MINFFITALLLAAAPALQIFTDFDGQIDFERRRVHAEERELRILEICQEQLTHALVSLIMAAAVKEAVMPINAALKHLIEKQKSDLRQSEEIVRLMKGDGQVGNDEAVN